MADSAATTSPAPGTATVLRGLKRELISAADAKIAKVVAMVDALPQRGEADALIAPLRPRMAELGIRRQLNFCRLLFLPLDPLIVPAVRWERGSLGVPRTALQPLADLLRRAMPGTAPEIDAIIAGADASDLGTVQRGGTLLWQAAGRILAQSAAPPDWAEATGLPIADFTPLAHNIAALLLQADIRHRMEQQAAQGREPDASVLEAMLGSAAVAGSASLGMLVTLLVTRMPQSATVNRLATRLSGPQSPAPLRAAADRAAEFVLDSIESTAPLSTDPVQAMADLRRLAAVLQELEARSAQSPSRLLRVGAARRHVDTACKARFDSALATRVLSPLEHLAEASSGEIAALERAARDMRRFELAARRVGSPQHYDRALAGTAEALQPRPGEDSATRMDRIRLAEILLGPDRARSMLEQA